MDINQLKEALNIVIKSNDRKKYQLIIKNNFFNYGEGLKIKKELGIKQWSVGEMIIRSTVLFRP
jgi:hypothetical protein